MVGTGQGWAMFLRTITSGLWEIVSNVHCLRDFIVNKGWMGDDWTQKYSLQWFLFLGGRRSVRSLIMTTGAIPLNIQISSSVWTPILAERETSYNFSVSTFEALKLFELWHTSRRYRKIKSLFFKGVCCFILNWGHLHWSEHINKILPKS